jgi:demethylmenaquinone methyltransferase/2-methoxy-6-polyprenyl-1,4-benzoquinol methylase
VREALLAKRSAEIRGMFERITPRYDLLNRILSLGRDVRWRRAVAESVAQIAPGRVLDMCTGTGDLALALPASHTTCGSDFCLPMLVRARDKAARSRRRLPLFAADAQQMPIGDGALDVVTVAFGIRNFEDLETGLRELARVLRPGGTLLALEFSRPRGPLGPLLGWWMRHVPALVGKLVSGDPEAYGYLIESAQSFPEGKELCDVLEMVGLRTVDATPVTGGVATVYAAVKARPSGDREEKR